MVESDEEMAKKIELSPLKIACGLQRLPSLELVLQASKDPTALVNKPFRGGAYPLVVACAKNDENLVKLLLFYGADPGIKLEHDWNLLHALSIEGALPLIQLLVAAGSDPNAQEQKSFNSPLHLACWKEQIELIKYLLVLGVNLEQRNHAGHTAFHVACLSGNKAAIEAFFDAREKATLETIFNRGTIHLEERTSDNKSPLELACESGSLESVDYLLRQGLNLSPRCLFFAVRSGKLPLVRMLLEKKGLDPRLIIDKISILRLAVYSGNPEIVAYLLSRYSLPLDHKDKKGRTALFHACREGQIAMAQCLIENGADLALTDIRSMSPFDIARKKGNTAIMSYIFDLATGVFLEAFKTVLEKEQS